MITTMHWGNESPATLIGWREVSASAGEAPFAFAQVGEWTSAAALEEIGGIVASSIKRVCVVQVAPQEIAPQDCELEFADIDQVVAGLELEDPAGMAEARQWAGTVLYQSPRESLRALRLAAGLSQIQFGREMNAGQAAISRWENGKADMRVSTIHRIAAVLKADVDDVWHAVCNSCSEDEPGNA
ncbi:helix-turn-helix domain-containing protein [Stenotrophomonas maltophilia]|uniref:helix-turn-helix domain-containing protein n=1 Tax=Stenotrophomonas maltophilia TaxID=40324 RepID=UPI0021C92F32|nr:helix-turn-helix domain-containing protein [Stenotrophomonas maltophilia]MCU1038758.1 helix-turn-helix domain-containing protein [Stenotrophomonas maltophilia]